KIFFLMIRRPPRSTQGVSSAASDVVEEISMIIISIVVYLLIPKSLCLLYTSPSPRDTERSRMPSSA
ncbi:hypothetical protein, partial [Staphylococcus aureus]